MDISILYFALALFVVGAGFGAAVLYRILKDSPTPKRAVLAHGLIGGTALVLVILYALNHAENAPVTTLILLLLAAGGGFTLLAFDLGKKKIPKALAIGHPIIALCGVIALIAFILGN